MVSLTSFGHFRRARNGITHYNSTVPIGQTRRHLAVRKEQPLGVFEAIASDTHEEVLYGHDPVSGLKAIIAIHSTALGPALGGTRFFQYETEDAALRDVLRLAKGMSYKSAAAGLDLGGGKAVIIGNPAELRRFLQSGATVGNATHFPGKADFPKNHTVTRH